MAPPGAAPVRIIGLLDSPVTSPAAGLAVRALLAGGAAGLARLLFLRAKKDTGRWASLSAALAVLFATRGDPNKSVAVVIARVLFTSLVTAAARLLPRVLVGPRFPNTPAELSDPQYRPLLLRAAGVDPNRAPSTAVNVRQLGNGFIGETFLATLDGPDLPAPIALVAKMSPRPVGRFANLRAGAFVYVREAVFYSSLAPELARVPADARLHVPTARRVLYSPVSGASLILMDPAPAGMVGGSEVKGASWQHACSVARRYASLHALHWAAPGAAGLPIDVKFFDYMQNPQGALDRVIWPAFREVLDDPAYACRDSNEMLHRAALPMLRNLSFLVEAVAARSPQCLVHGDARMENMLIPKSEDHDADEVGPDPEVTLDYDRTADWMALDWQTLCRAPGVYDLAYFVALCLRVRPGCDDSPDRALVGLYRASLEARGVDLSSYPFDKMYDDYRVGVAIAAMIPLVVMSPGSIGTDRIEDAKRVRAAMIAGVLAAMARVGSAEALADVLGDQAVGSTPPGVTPPTARRLVHTIRPPTSPLEHPLPSDDAFSHHSPASLAALPADGPPGTSRRDAYDRWYLGGASPDGKCFFALACGFYPGRGVVDAAFSVVSGGKQDTVRASRASTGADFGATETVVGPITVRVLEPLERVEVVVADTGSGISARLVFRSRFPAEMEPPFKLTMHPVGAMDYSRLTQLVEWDGTLSARGLSWQAEGWYGTRDRSWGLRPHPSADRTEKENGGAVRMTSSKGGRWMLNALAKGDRAPQFYWWWTPLNFKTHGLLAHTQQRGDGTPQNESAVLLTPSGPLLALSCRVEVEYGAGTRHARRARMRLELPGGGTADVEAEPLYPFLMSGIGYQHPSWPHGAAKAKPGEPAAVGFDKSDAVHVDRMRADAWHIQEVSRLWLVVRGADGAVQVEEDGVGVLEQLSVGPHAPSGFAAVCDA